MPLEFMTEVSNIQIYQPVELIENYSPNSNHKKLDFKKELLNFLNRSNSAGTRSTYANYLKDFFEFNKLKFPSEIVDEDVLRWRDSMKRSGKKENTIKTKLACVRSFFEYLCRKGFLIHNPANTYLVPPPKVADILSGRALDGGEVKNLLSLPKIETITGARDYALIMLMLRCFLRVSEALSLRDTDFFPRKGIWYAEIKIKGGERKSTPIPLEVKQAIDAYLLLDRDHRRLVKARENEGKFIFLPSAAKKRDITENKAIGSRHAWHLVKAYGRLSGIGKLTPHDFRRTAITKALDQGESYRRVQNAARLKNISTVRRYDQHREALEENSILTLNYDEKPES